MGGDIELSQCRGKVCKVEFSAGIGVGGRSIASLTLDALLSERSLHSLTIAARENP